jgi:glutamate synthase (NADPH/NADH) large chain
MTTAAEIEHLQEHGLYSGRERARRLRRRLRGPYQGRKEPRHRPAGLKILENLDHRGAVGADKLMGDGAGILIQLPDRLYREEMAKQGVTLPPPANTASA